MQDVSACGPEKETCVANQTLKDKICLVPCDGLYSDIADDSLKQNMMKGRQPPIFSPNFKINIRFPYNGKRIEPSLKTVWSGHYVS